MISRIEKLLYREAQLLDSGLFDDWLELLALDVRYWAPVRAMVAGKEEAESESSRLPLFDETKASLRLRVKRLQTGLAWVETPPTRTRRFIANVTAENGTDGFVHVRSNFMVFRSRNFAEEWLVVGCREDKWTNADKWLLRERKITLDHCTIENMSLFL